MKVTRTNFAHRRGLNGWGWATELSECDPVHPLNVCPDMEWSSDDERIWRRVNRWTAVIEYEAEIGVSVFGWGPTMAEAARDARDYL